MSRLLGAQRPLSAGKWDSLYYVEVDDSRTIDWMKKNKLSNVAMEVIDKETGDLIRELAREIANLAPVDTGYMRDQILSGVRKEGNGDWVIKRGTDYTVRQNFEHKTNAHFITNPTERAIDKYSNMVMDAIEKEMF